MRGLMAFIVISMLVVSLSATVTLGLYLFGIIGN